MKRVLHLPFAVHAHVAGGDAPHRAVVVVEKFGRREARIDLDAERLGLRAEVARDIGERADEAAVIAHQRRQQEIWNAHPARRAEPVEAVFLHFDLERPVGVLAPAGHETVEADRIDGRARENVRADLRALFHDDDAGLWRDLLEPDGCGEPGRAGAHDDDVVVHAFAFGQIGCVGHGRRHVRHSSSSLSCAA